MSQMGCYAKYGSRAHRICEPCWFNDFVPSNDHRCPGCIKGLNHPPVRPKNQDPVETIELLSDD